MLSVSEAAEMLGISSSRVRQLIANDALQASKVGRAWCIHEESILARIDHAPKPGRPETTARFAEPTAEESEKRAQRLHDLYEQCRKEFSLHPSMADLKNAATNDEATFYMAIADFFLQQRQRELVAQGVY